MNITLKNAADNIDLIWKSIEFNGVRLSKEQVRQIVEYGKSQGYKTLAEIPDQEIDQCLNMSKQKEN